MNYGFLDHYQKDQLDEIVTQCHFLTINQSRSQILASLQEFTDQTFTIFNPVDLAILDQRTAIADLLTTYLLERFDLPYTNQFENDYLDYNGEISGELKRQLKRSVSQVAKNQQLIIDRLAVKKPQNAVVPPELLAYSLIIQQSRIGQLQRLKNVSQDVNESSTYQQARLYYRHFLAQSIGQYQYLQEQFAQLNHHYQHLVTRFRGQILLSEYKEIINGVTDCEQQLENQLAMILYADIAGS